MMQPKKTKFRKAHKGRIHGVATSGATLSFGQFGLKAMAPERLTARQIEAARRALTRHMKRAGRVWIRIFPAVAGAKKPAEVRMGSGKGTPELWVARVKPGRVIFEIDGVTVQTAKEALSLAAAKLPIKRRFVARFAEEVRGLKMPKRTLQGVVVSDKQAKTVVVRVDRRFTHPIYKKTIRRSKNYHAHDENNEFKPGDQVWIEESKPISKLKRWTVVRGEQKKTAGAP